MSCPSIGRLPRLGETSRKRCPEYLLPRNNIANGGYIFPGNTGRANSRDLDYFATGAPLLTPMIATC